MTDDDNICQNCGEPMDEYDDCTESEDGKHTSKAERDKMLDDLRRARADSLSELERKFDALRAQSTTTFTTTPNAKL